MTAELTLFGEILQAFMDRAEVSGPAELAQRMHEEGNDHVSEETLIKLMYGTYEATGEERPELDWGGGDKALGTNDEEVGLMARALLMRYDSSRLEHRFKIDKLWWELKRAMARRQITPLEELTDEEASSEVELWWKVYGSIADASFHLERRWVFEEEGEALLQELRELEDKANQLSLRIARRVREGAA